MARRVLRRGLRLEAGELALLPGMTSNPQAREPRIPPDVLPG
jgi:hypothetical protein